MRRNQESAGFRRTGCTVGAASSSGYGYSASDGTGYTGMGDRRNVTTVHATATPSRHHNNPGVVVNQRRERSPPRETVTTTTYRTVSEPVQKPRTVVTTVTYVQASGSGCFCRKCGRELPIDGRFCEGCGEAAPGVQPRCPNPNCREHISNNDKFCPSCGTHI